MFRHILPLLLLFLLHAADLTNLNSLLSYNQLWANTKTTANSSFFTTHDDGQAPKYLWIGCSDSRVPPNLLLGLDVGEVFVLRNIANMAAPSDISVQAVIQYTVEVLRVTDIIVAGHYLCGGVAASLTVNNYGMLEFYLSRLRHLSLKHESQLSSLTGDAKTNRLVELNVAQQVLNVAATPFLQTAWASGQTVRVHGMVYDLNSGTLVDLNMTKSSLSDIPSALAVVTVQDTSTEDEDSSRWVLAGIGIGLFLVLVLVLIAGVIAARASAKRYEAYQQQESKATMANTRDQLSKESIIAQ